MTVNWWTLGIQAVNVLILMWLLQHFFWRPVAAMIEQRRAMVQHTVADAEASRTEATAALADIERTRAGFGEEREQILREAHAAADSALAATLSDASKQAASLLATANIEIDKEKADAEQAWTERASQLAVDIAGRLASRLDGASIQAAFLDWLIMAIQALPAQDRQAAANGTRLEALSATALSPADQERADAMIGKAFGGHRPIVFRVDPALIAGLELHGDHFSVGNSWRADLAAILGDLTRATRH